VAATLKKLTSERVTETVVVGSDPDDTITFTYNPKALTIDLAEMLEEAADSARFRNILRPVLLTMLTEWDLRPDDGEPVIPLTGEALGTLPLHVLEPILDVILNGQSPKEATVS
jgi:hypothetical protein